MAGEVASREQNEEADGEPPLKFHEHTFLISLQPHHLMGLELNMPQRPIKGLGNWAIARIAICMQWDSASESHFGATENVFI